MEIELGISNNAHDNIEQPVGRKKEEKEKKKSDQQSQTVQYAPLKTIRAFAYR